MFESREKRNKIRTSISCIAKAAHVLHGVPRLGVYSVGLGSQMLLGPAGAAIVAVLGANGTLACDAIVAWKALAGTSLSVANSLVAALLPRVNIIGVDNSADPSKVLGADTL